METWDEGLDQRPIRPAATMLLVRDGELGLEILMVKRSKSMRSFPGFLAFPGGSVEQEDCQCARQCTRGEVRGQQHTDDAAFAVAALRETAEEIGWLGGTVRSDGTPCAGMITPKLQTALLHEKRSLHQELTAKHWVFDMEQLRFVGRWVTPVEVNIPVRFDARFFVMRGFAETLPLRIHGNELEWAKWGRPGELLEEIRLGTETAALPTQSMLTALATMPNVDCCLEFLEVAPPRLVT
jgi:8-oxo-dGTP pyrophosphatase MutT (NUDIX family)